MISDSLLKWWIIFYLQALLSVRDREALGSQLLSVAGQRLCHVIVNDSESSERVSRLSRLPTNICSWIKAQVTIYKPLWRYIACHASVTLTICVHSLQDPSKLVCRSVPVSHTIDLLSMLLTLLPQQSPNYGLASSLAETVKFLF